MARTYLSVDRVAEIAASLTPKDEAILHTLERVRLATGEQLGRLHFRTHSDRERRRVLARLVDKRLLARLPRVVGGVRAGSRGHVFALDVAGQRLVGQLSSSDRRRIQRPWTPGTMFLAHTLAVTECYVRVVEAELAGRLELLRFTAEPASWRRFAGPGGGRAVLKPDAYLELALGQYEDRWLIEVDRGTEAPSTLTRKLDTYRAYRASGREQAGGGVFPRVLILVPNERRRQAVVDVCGRQPADSWKLFRVALFDQLVEVLAKGAA